MSRLKKNREHLATLRNQHVTEMRVREARKTSTTKPPVSSKSFALFRNIAVGVMALGMAGAYVSGAPHALSASETKYRGQDMFKIGNVLSAGDREKLAEIRDRYGMRFDRILTPGAQESTTPMQRVAASCLPNSMETIVIPSKKARVTFAQSTKYLVCAMAKYQERLCDAKERKRLAEQLKQYTDRRMDMLGLERHFRSNGYQLQQYERLNQEVANGISALAKRGLLSASDFSPMGLFVPADYAEVFEHKYPSDMCS